MSNQKNTYVVYKHTNLITNKIYIGITIHGNNPNRRWESGSGYKANTQFFSDIQQYGWDNFSHEILASNLSEKDALRLEEELILVYDSVNQGYNQSYGNNVHGPMARKKISQALQGIKRTPESIEKQLNTKQERTGYKSGINPLNNNNCQKVRCKETQDVFCSIQEAINWCHSSKVQQCCIGERLTAGTNPINHEQVSWEYVSKDTPITIRCTEKYIPISHPKIQCIETGIIYDSAAEASRLTRITACNILRVCKQQRKTAGGYHWQYITENKGD